MLPLDRSGPMPWGRKDDDGDNFSDDEVTRVDDATAELYLRDAPFEMPVPVSSRLPIVGAALVALGSLLLVIGFSLVGVSAALAAGLIRTPVPERVPPPVPTLVSATPIVVQQPEEEQPPAALEAPTEQPPAEVDAVVTPGEPTTAPEWVARGWAVVGRDPGLGAEAFRRAIRLAPEDAEAAYGLGYALLSLDDVSGATPWLCRALVATTDRDTLRDLEVLVKRHRLVCAPPPGVTAP